MAIVLMTHVKSIGGTFVVLCGMMVCVCMWKPVWFVLLDLPTMPLFGSTQFLFKKGWEQHEYSRNNSQTIKLTFNIFILIKNELKSNTITLDY